MVNRDGSKSLIFAPHLILSRRVLEEEQQPIAHADVKPCGIVKPIPP